MKRIPVPGADRFWAWCADLGVTSRPLQLVSDSKFGKSILAGDTIKSRGAVVAAIPYSSASSTFLSPILNAETLPLGLVPPLLPLPDDLGLEWRRQLRRLERKQKLRVKQNEPPSQRIAQKITQLSKLNSSLGPMERKFVWLAGVLACAAADRSEESRLFRVYGPYFDLLLQDAADLQSKRSSSLSNVLDDKRTAAIYNELVTLHQLPCDSISHLMSQRADSMRVAADSPLRKGIPNPQLVNWALREVLRRSVSIRAGCPPERESQNRNKGNGDDDEQQPSGNRSGSSSTLIGGAQRYLERDDDDDNAFLLPSFVPVVDLLNHSDSPNCTVLTTESRPDDGGNDSNRIRRVAILSLRPIQEGEMLTCSYNLFNDAAAGSNPEARALSAFRFGF